MKIIVAIAFSFVHIVTFIYLSYAEKNQSRKPEKCSLLDSACLTTQAQNTLQAFIEGIPEIGIEKLDELHTDPVIAQDINGFYYNWTNIKVEGLRNAVIDNVSINMDLKTLRISFETSVDVHVDYSANGVMLLVLPIFGKGKGKITLRRLYLEIFSVFDIVKDNKGKDFMELKKYLYGFDATDGIHFYFDNLYDGDKIKSQIFLNLLNNNWRTVAANYSIYFNRKMTDKIFEAIKIYMRSRPLEELALY